MLLCQPVKESSYCACAVLSCLHIQYCRVCVCFMCVCSHVVGKCVGRLIAHVYVSFVFVWALRRCFFFECLCVCMVTEPAVFLLLCLCVALASEYRQCTLACFVCPRGWRTSVEEALYFGPQLWERLCSRSLTINPWIVEGVEMMSRASSSVEKMQICFLSCGLSCLMTKQEEWKRKNLTTWFSKQTRKCGWGF